MIESGLRFHLVSALHSVLCDCMGFSVTVLFFGATADLASRRSITLDLPAGSSTLDAYAKVMEIFPQLSGRKLHISLNEEYARGEEPVREGDEIAIFTAVSGG